MIRLEIGDFREVLKALPDNSVWHVSRRFNEI